MLPLSADCRRNTVHLDTPVLAPRQRKRPSGGSESGAQSKAKKTEQGFCVGGLGASNVHQCRPLEAIAEGVQRIIRRIQPTPVAIVHIMCFHSCLKRSQWRDGDVKLLSDVVKMRLQVALNTSNDDPEDEVSQSVWKTQLQCDSNGPCPMFLRG